jgi:hypothetical protein
VCSCVYLYSHCCFWSVGLASDSEMLVLGEEASAETDVVVVKID